MDDSIGARSDFPLHRHHLSALGVSVEDLRSRQRRPEVVRARETLVVAGVERYGLRVADVANALSKSPDTMTKAIARATRRRAKEREYLRALDQLDHAIAKDGRAANNGGMA